MSVKFLSAILGPEMAAPILWTPGKKASVLQEKPCPSIPRFGGGRYFGFWGGGGSADFIFMGARIFLALRPHPDYRGNDADLPRPFS